MMVFSGNSNRKLAQEICRFLDIPLSPLNISKFSNDNLYVQIGDSVRGRDVFLVQSLTHPVSEHIMELLIALDALRSASASRITAVIPYYSYARSDKKDAPRISIAGRLIADLIENAGADRVLTMDLHADAVHGFFSIPVDHLTAIPTIGNYFKDRLNLSETVVVATDAGGAKRAGKFAERLGTALAIIDKRRISDTRVEQGVVIGNVKGMDAVIFDDEISTGGTLVTTCKTLEIAGVRKVYVGVTHPVLCGPAVDKLSHADVEKIVATNTVDVPESKQFDQLQVLSVGSLFGDAIRRIHKEETMGALFE